MNVTDVQAQAHALEAGIAALDVRVTVLESSATALAWVEVRNMRADRASPAETRVTFGLPCKQGAVPQGCRLRLEVNGSPIRSQADLRSLDSTDNSLVQCEVSCVIGSIPAGGWRDIVIKQELGAWDNVPRRTPADITGRSDFKFELSSVKDFASNAPVTATDTTNHRLTSVNTFARGTPIKFDTTGGGVTAGTTYFARYISQNVFSVHPTANDAVNNTNIIHLTASLNGVRVIKNPVTQGSGAFTGALNSCTHVELLKSGPVCELYKFWDYFKDNNDGVADPRLSHWHYATVWTRNDETVGPISHFPTVHNGWMSSANQTLLCYDAVLKNGSTVIRDFKKTATVAVIDLTTNRLTAPNHGFRTKFLAKVVSSDGPSGQPGGTFTDVVYPVYVVDQNTLTLHVTGPQAALGQFPVDITSKGTGTITLVKSIYHIWHSGWDGTDDDSLPDWTEEDPEIFVAHDPVYLLSTGAFPPLDPAMKVTPAADPNPSPYSPQYCDKLRVDISGTGGSGHIGLSTAWDASAVLTQEPGYRKTARTNARSMGHLYVQVRNEATGKIPTYVGTGVNGAAGNFPGLGTSKQTSFFFGPGTKSADFAMPAGPVDIVAVNTTGDPSHWPAAIYPTYFMEGGAWHIDCQLMHANYVGMWRYVGGADDAGNRNQRFLPTRPIFYGVHIRNYANIRSDAWGDQAFLHAYRMTPNLWDEKAYLWKVLVTNYAYAAEMITQSPQAMRDLGHWHFRSGDLDSPWMHNFGASVACLAAKYTGLPDALVWAKHMLIQPKMWCDPATFPSPLNVTAYRASASYQGLVNPVDYVATWNDMGIWWGSITFNSTDVLAWNIDKGGTTHFNFPFMVGDKIKFTYYNASLAATNPATPFQKNVWYHVVQVVDPAHIKISDTPGGAPIAATQSLTAGDVVVRHQAKPTIYGPTNDTASPLLIALFALRFGMAIGITGLEDSEANLSAFQKMDLGALNNAHYSNPQWAAARAYSVPR